jgi:pyrimidine-specific ribonucleoside hydrolase
MLQSFGAVDSPYAEKIVAVHRSETVLERVESGHLKLWDDLLPVYLLFPDSFECRTAHPVDPLKLCTVGRPEEVNGLLVDTLTSRNNVKSLVFKGFPESPNLFADDVQPIMKEIIEKHGKEEWRLGVLTNEMHGHLGIYAIVGAKMGLRAREHFNIGVDDFAVVSYAGATPPLSCMNDGLQVSTGGTVGHGLFSLSSEPSLRPEATFTFHATTIRLRLKDPYWETARRDLKKGVELYGTGSDEYWTYVRELALRYWLEWDRRELFVLEPES